MQFFCSNIGQWGITRMLILVCTFVTSLKQSAAEKWEGNPDIFFFIDPLILHHQVLFKMFRCSRSSLLLITSSKFNSVLNIEWSSAVEATFTQAVWMNPYFRVRAERGSYTALTFSALWDYAVSDKQSGRNKSNFEFDWTKTNISSESHSFKQWYGDVLLTLGEGLIQSLGGSSRSSGLVRLLCMPDYPADLLTWRFTLSGEATCQDSGAVFLHEVDELIVF